MNIVISFGLVTWVTCVLLAILVIKFGNIKNPLHTTLILLNIAISIWGFGYMMVGISKANASQAALWWRIAHVGGLYIPVLVLHNTLIFNKIKKKTFLIFAYFQATVFQVFSAINLMDSNLTYVVDSYYKLTSVGIIYPLGCLAWWSVSLYASFILFKSFLQAHGAKRTQLKYLFTGIVMGLFGGGTHFLSVFNISSFPYTMFLIPFFPLITTYGILQHQLMDIKVVVKKAIVYSFLISIITTLYLVLIYVLEKGFSVILGYHSIPLAIFMIAIFSIIFTPLKSKIQYVIDKYFFHGTIDQIDEENIKLREELQKTEKLKAISTLAAGMAHEIKNPLTSIKTFTEYLPQKGNDPEFREKFQKIVGKEVDRVNYIVKGLLEFSKPQELKIKNSDINALLDETLSLLSNDFVKNDIKVEKNYSTLSSARIDPSQMKQVFLNIFLNAIDSMGNGGLLNVETGTDATDKIYINVTDTGEGINKEDLKRIFDPFFSKKDGGTGLGLSVVHGIIEKHCGKISVDSQPGVGTQFEIVLNIE